MSERTFRDPHTRPLQGCRVVITRPRSQSEALEGLLKDLGATVLSFPTIEIADPSSFDELDAALRAVAAGAYEWTVFLSANAVEKVTSRLGAMSFDISALTRSRIAAVGRATADALATHGVTADLLPEVATSAGVADALGLGSGRVLVPRAAKAPEDALDTMRSNGWLVDGVVAYRTEIAPESPGAQVIRQRDFDVVTFTSGSTVRGFAATVSASEAGLSPEDSGACKVVCIGPATAEVAAGLGFRIDAIAQEPSSEGLVEATLGIR